MSERLRSYFRHYRSERRGVIVVLILVVLIIGGGELFTIFYKPQPEPFQILLIDGKEDDILADKDSIQRSRKEIQPFLFDPNQLADSGYAALGFSEKEIQILRNYQAAGGEFRVKSDFAKLFFVDEEEYQKLKPFIDLPETIAPKQPRREKYMPREPVMHWSDTVDTAGYRYEPFVCNLNTADTNELKKLRGIGSFYANKIVEYRQELGGYHNLAQLLELWEMTPEKIDAFADHVTIDPEDLKHMNINSVSAYELSQHPYVSFGLANQIILKREELGGFRSADHLCSSGLLAPELCRKLVPYLIFAP